MGTVHLFRLLSLFTGITALQQVKSWIITVPRTVTAVEGSCVVVPCQTQPHSHVTWYNYHKTWYPVVYDKLYPETVEEQFRGRTSVPGNAAEGNCTLMIKNVRWDDNNLQVYVWIYPESKKQRFYDQTVTIVVERRTPIISVPKQVVDGEFFHVNCSISHSCPFSPPPLHWTITCKDGFSRNDSFSQRVQEGWLYTEMMVGQAKYEMHNSKIRCSAQFTTFTTESQQVTLNILYKPVTVTLTAGEETVMEGGTVVMECAANSDPKPNMYTWLRRQMGQVNETISTERKMFFSNITRDTSLSCIAHNRFGVGQSDWLDLNVQYAPEILPESSCHLTGKVLQCICQAKASPKASINWIINGNNSLSFSFRVLSTNKTDVVSGEISGPGEVQTNVTCTAWNSLGNDTKQLYIGNFSSFSPMWLLTLMVLGTAVLFGCAVFIYRKYFRNRLQMSSLDAVQEEQRYNSFQRQQAEDIQSSPCGSERNPGMESLDCIYANDIVEEMRRTRAQQHANNERAHQREGALQPLAKGVDCPVDVYLNC